MKFLPGTWDREVEIVSNHLFRQQDDLTHVELDVSNRLIDGFQNRDLSPLRVR